MKTLSACTVCEAEDVPCGTDAIHQHTPAEIPRQHLNLSTISHAVHTIRTPAIAQVPMTVPRAGVVNARRPGHRPGRSEAKSIDDAEHGTSMKGAMVRCLVLDLQAPDVFCREPATRTN